MKILFAGLLASFLIVSIRLDALEIIAHRGASFDAPENTLASFNVGWKQGADADELDIYLSKDGEVIVLHDATTKRTAGLDKPVVDRTLAELRNLDAGSWKGPQWAGEKLPTLAEALATIPEGKAIYIEIKCGPEVLPGLKKVIDASGKKPAQLPIIGFGYGTMAKARELFPEHAVYLLASYAANKTTGAYPQIDELIEKARAARLTGLDLDFKFPIDAAFVATVKGAGLKLCAWTVDDALVAKKLVEAGVDGITTNRPAWLREQLK